MIVARYGTIGFITQKINVGVLNKIINYNSCESLAKSAKGFVKDVEIKKRGELRKNWLYQTENYWNIRKCLSSEGDHKL